MEKLGLNTPLVSKTPTKKREKRPAGSGTPTRRSSRNAGKPSTDYSKEKVLTFMEDAAVDRTVLRADSDDDDDDDDAAPTTPKRVRQTKRKRAAADGVPELTAAQRSALRAKYPGDSWLPKFEAWLWKPDGKTLAEGGVCHVTAVRAASKQNFNNTMRIVRPLTAGTGSLYKRWKTGFMVGEKLDLAADCFVLRQRAAQHEKVFGKDLGNGWAANHPLQKVENFQKYLAAQI